MGVRGKAELDAQGREFRELAVDIAPLRLESVARLIEALAQHSHLGLRGMDDLRKQRLDHPGAEPGREQVLDPHDQVDVVGPVQALTGVGAPGMQQPLLLVVSQRALAHARSLGQLPDPHRCRRVHARHDRIPARCPPPLPGGWPSCESEALVSLEPPSCGGGRRRPSAAGPPPRGRDGHREPAQPRRAPPTRAPHAGSAGPACAPSDWTRQRSRVPQRCAS